MLRHFDFSNDESSFTFILMWFIGLCKGTQISGGSKVILRMRPLFHREVHEYRSLGGLWLAVWYLRDKMVENGT